MKRLFTAILAVFFGGVVAALPARAQSDEKRSAETAAVLVEYNIFATRELAREFLQGYEKNFLSKQESRPAREIIGFDDPRYAALQARVDELFWAYQKNFPARLNGFTQAPPVLLIEDRVPNAYALGPAPSDKLGRIPYLFMVHTGVLALKISDDELSGLLAHELAHLFLGHTRPGAPELLQKFYRVSAGNEPLGFQQANDPAIQSTLFLWIRLAGAVGPLTYLELGGLPTPLGQTKLFEMLSHVRKKADAAKTSCAQVGPSYAAWASVVAPAAQKSWNGESPDPEQLSLVGIVSARHMLELRRCFGDLQMSLAELFTSIYTADLAQTSAALAQDSLTAVFDKAPNVVDGLVAYTGALQAKMREIEAAQDFKSLRYYSVEEQADDFSVLAMRSLGKNPLGLAHFIKNQGMSPADSTACQSLIDSGHTPAYGTLADNHHANCYRIWHMNAVNKFIDQNQR